MAAAVSQKIFSDAFLWMKSFEFWLKISPQFVAKRLIDNNPEFV